MSYTLFSKTKPVARKEHGCIWCRELIAVGSVYVREASTYSCDFQSHKWHPECWDAAQKYFAEGEEEFDPHTHKRGSLEEA